MTTIGLIALVTAGVIVYVLFVAAVCQLLARNGRELDRVWMLDRERKS